MRWLNRNVAGMTLTSFLADTGHKMVTAVLPGFLNAIGVAAAALGWIEGASDAAASFIKLAAGWYSYRIGHRKGIVYSIADTARPTIAGPGSPARSFHPSGQQRPPGTPAGAPPHLKWITK